jgi:hypothetical protein
MDEAELKRAGSTHPSIDTITIAEFRSVEEEREWVRLHASTFAPA